MTKPEHNNTVRPIEYKEMLKHGIRDLSITPNPETFRQFSISFIVAYKDPVTEKEAYDAFLAITKLHPEAVQMLDSIYPRTLHRPMPVSPKDDRFYRAIFTVPFQSDDGPVTCVQAAKDLTNLLCMDILPESIQPIYRGCQ